MIKLPEPDDVDLFVGGVEPGAGTSIETVRFVEECKKRPDYPCEAGEPEQILASLGNDPRDYGKLAAKSLLDHWQCCVADLVKVEIGETNGRTADQENIPLSCHIPGTTQI